MLFFIPTGIKFHLVFESEPPSLRYLPLDKGATSKYTRKKEIPDETIDKQDQTIDTQDDH